MMTMNAYRLRNRLWDKVGSNELVDLGQLMRDVGYSKYYSRWPNRLLRKPYMQSVIQNLESEINRIQEELKNKDLSEVQYESLVRAMDIQVKNKQLLSGGATERVFNVSISDAVAKKNEINK